MKETSRFYLNRKKRSPFQRRFREISLAAAIVFAAALTIWVGLQRGLLVEARTETATEQLAEQVLRFHVLADSNSARDQQIKMRVKEAVIAYLQEEIPEDETRRGTRAFVQEHLEEIEEVAEETIRQEGGDETAAAELVMDEFPEKTYGDVTFPEGTYEALRIRIGRGEGRNWWCCLYPNLCFTDAVCGEVVREDKQELKDLLDEDTYDMITCTTDFRIKWFFFDNR